MVLKKNGFKTYSYNRDKIIEKLEWENGMVSEKKVMKSCRFLIEIFKNYPALINLKNTLTYI